MLVFYLSAALLFTFKGRLFQIFGMKRWLGKTVGRLFYQSAYQKGNDGISQAGAFCSVLAACIGTGNIVGVASAIASGGPGAVFWMVLSAFFGMATAYAENMLGIRYRHIGQNGTVQGGAFMYMEHGVGMPGMSKIYAGLCLFSSLGSGNMTQANSVSESLYSGFSIPRPLVAIVCAALCLLIMKGGVKRIAKLNEYVVPAMGLGFLVLSACLLLKNKSKILPCSADIFREAFQKKGGVFSGASAMRYGVARGVFSNEAGLGTSTILHAENQTASAPEQGYWGAFEVFCDTILLCGITALCLLVSGAFSAESPLFGAELSIAAYATLGQWGQKGIALLTAVFGLASLIGWSFYGEKSSERLFSKKRFGAFLYFYAAVAFIGCVTSPKLIWSLADITSGLMAVPNLFSLIVLRNEIEWERKIKTSDASRRRQSRRA